MTDSGKLTAAEFARYFDHTFLKAAGEPDAVRRLCREAKPGFATGSFPCLRFQTFTDRRQDARPLWPCPLLPGRPNPARPPCR